MMSATICRHTGLFEPPPIRRMLLALQAGLAQQIQSVTQTEGGAFDHGAAQVGAGQVGHGQAVHTAGGVGQGGHAFAVEERQHAHAVGADGRLGDQGVEGQVEVEQLANHPGGVGQVHGADQRQPAAAGGAEGRHRCIRADLGCSAKAYTVPDEPRLMVITPGAILPVPMAPIMLSPPPLATMAQG
jgi:catechol 2,3-dioxygenase-like lactoylglutathione lyase family enzyme